MSYQRNSHEMSGSITTKQQKRIVNSLVKGNHQQTDSASALTQRKTNSNELRTQKFLF